MAAAIFITEGEAYAGVYNDCISVDIYTGDMHIDVKGQNDAIENIENNHQVHIFSRRNENVPFTYQGIARYVYKINRQIPNGVRGEIDQLTVYCFVIERQNVVGTVIPKNMNLGNYCYKKSCINYLGYDTDGLALQPCFVKLE